MGILLLQLCFLVFTTVATGSEFDPSRQGVEDPWTFACINKECHKVLKAQTPLGGVPMDICKLNCDDKGSLLPLPTGNIEIGKGLFAFYAGRVTFGGYETNSTELISRLTDATNTFKGYLDKMIDADFPPSSNGTISQNAVTVVITISTDTLTLGLRTDESYSLIITPGETNVVVEIQAVTYYGGRHALETLSQLIAYDIEVGAFQIVSIANIEDKPAYPYRGIMVDTSRNYISLAYLRKIIDGMSYNKLNMFHWHLTDSHSHPMEVEGFPQFHQYGAYSPKKVYTIADMKAFVEYARVRGVKVVAEFDEPAHVGYGWEWGPSAGLGELTVCFNKQPWYDFCVEPPCGQLNIGNLEVYKLLDGIFKSMLSVFDNDLFHMGGDEVDFRCYNSTPEVTDWMAKHGLDRTEEGFVEAWNMFQEEAHGILVNASSDPNIQSIMWNSELTKPEHIEKYLNKDNYIIQLWSEVKNKMTMELIDLGYRAIFSNYDTMYLDCGFHAWIGNGHNWCSPYKTWQTIYENSPYKIIEEASGSAAADDAFSKGLLLGSEIPLWMEGSDELSLENRIWPRGCAHSERLWTNPSTTGWAEAEYRMVTNRQRFVQRGLAPDRIQPEFCSQNQNNCYGYPPGEGEEPTTTATTPPSTNTTDPTATTPGDNKGSGSTLGFNVLLILVSYLFGLLYTH